MKILCKYLGLIHALASFTTNSNPFTNNAFITTLLTTPTPAIPITGPSHQKEAALYNQSTFRSFNFEITPYDFARMTANPTNETKVPCKLTLNYNTPSNQTFSDFLVCRYKGSVGSLRYCFTENGHTNGECRKLSLAVENLHYKKKSSLFKRLLFNGMPVDLSLMSERSAYFLMQNFGMNAPLSTHAKLFVNNIFWGLYSFVQPIDEHFINTRFSNDSKGALFKDLWLNPLHVSNLKKDKKSDVKFIRQVMAEIEKTPLQGGRPLQFFTKYFDIPALVNLTAFNTLIGNTDDWRQRHNFFVYVTKKKKLVFLPWDYDRIYDNGNANRGVLQGKPWWDINATATPSACNQTILSSEQKARAAAGPGASAAMIAWYEGIFQELPPDLDIPVTCDKFTQLMAFALKNRILSRTRYFANHLDLHDLQKQWNVWNNQIMTALTYDKDGPAVAIALAEQKMLYQHLSKARAAVLLK